MTIDKVSKPAVIVAVKDAGRREAYLSALGSSVDCTVTETLGGIPDILRQGPYSGILIDIKLNVKASHMDKVRISDSLAAMPSATVNFNAGLGLIKLFMFDGRHGNIRTLEEFAALCATFQPETFCPPGLGGLYLNAVLSADPDFNRDAERTFTMQVSGSGCFLVTANNAGYNPGDYVWIDFVGLADRNKVSGKVCWKSEWGVSHTVPGIYISFESIQEEQYEEIMSLLRLQA